jgi:hypothetical protein
MTPVVGAFYLTNNLSDKISDAKVCKPDFEKVVDYLRPEGLFMI